MTRRALNKILRDVSRSFYLSIRFLPNRMRAPVGLGYLLARASDTLADTAEAPVSLRVETLSEFREAIVDNRSLPDFEPFYRYQSHPGEKTLLQNLEQVRICLSQLDDSNQAAVREAFDKITQGQLWDLQKAAEVRQRPVTHEQLEEYTYSVAGCVGEFWTKIGFVNLGEKFAADEHRDALMRSGKMFGQGLQLINIIRDLGEDLKDGRCYLPVTKTVQQGVRGEPELLVREMKVWQANCRDWLLEGWTYLEKLRHHRVRFATALPLIIGERTLSRLEAEGARVLEHRIKVDRGEVKKILWKAWWARKSVEKLRRI